MTKYIFRLIVGLMFMCGSVSAQEKKGEILFKAMQDELDRNMLELSLPKMGHPFFMEYVICEGKQLQMSATLGSINSISELPFERGIYTRVLVGNFKMTNTLSYETRRSPMFAPFNTTIDNDYGQIRRDLWRQTDAAFKNAIQEGVKKMSAYKVNTLSSNEISLSDFGQVTPVHKIFPSNNIVFDKAALTHTVEELSAVFKDYPDIEFSEVTAKAYSNDVYVLNSESSKYSFPNNMLTLDVTAMGRSEGKVTSDKMSLCVLQQQDLPSLEELKSQIKVFAEKLLSVRNAQSVTETYSGPVLFEGNAVGVLFGNELFLGSGVYATRESSQGTNNTTLQEKMDSKIISNEFTVKCMPFLKEYEGKKLVGAFEMDMEGIVPAKELTLVENGILKHVIGTRVPSKYNSAPSGYFRSGTSPLIVQELLCPGVVDISTSRGVSKDTLKQLLIRTAKENGNKYAYIIRKLEAPISSLNPIYKPIYLYRVNVENGSEVIVRDSEIRELRKGLLKTVLGASNKKNVVNFVASGTVPITYITPDAVLLPDLEIAVKKDIQKTLPSVVLNPLKDKI